MKNFGKFGRSLLSVTFVFIDLLHVLTGDRCRKSGILRRIGCVVVLR